MDQDLLYKYYDLNPGAIITVPHPMAAKPGACTVFRCECLDECILTYIFCQLFSFGRAPMEKWSALPDRVVHFGAYGRVYAHTSPLPLVPKGIIQCTCAKETGWPLH